MLALTRQVVDLNCYCYKKINRRAQIFEPEYNSAGIVGRRSPLERDRGLRGRIAMRGCVLKRLLVNVIVRVV
jgi:hypothetical protein